MNSISENSERFATNERVEIQVYGQGTQLQGFLKNLSRTGAGLEILNNSQGLQKGDLVSLTIELSSLSKTHNVDAEVIWSNETAVGVTFMKQSEVFSKMIFRASGS